MQVRKLPTSVFMFLRHPLTHLDRWHVFFTKCPRDYQCCQTTLPKTENTIILFVCPPKFWICIVFVFLRDHCKSHEKVVITLIQNLGGQTKSIVVFSFRAIAIVGFHSRDQQPCLSTKTKESVCTIKELNSRRIWSGLQHGRRFFV